MNGDFTLSMEPPPEQIGAALKGDIKAAAHEFFEILAKNAPEALREVIDSSSPAGRRYGSHVASAIGQPPANRTGELSASFRAQVTGDLEMAVEMAEHARFLDPFLGGDLNRPFLERGIEAAAAKSLIEFVK